MARWLRIISNLIITWSSYLIFSLLNFLILFVRGNKKNKIFRSQFGFCFSSRGSKFQLLALILSCIIQICGSLNIYKFPRSSYLTIFPVNSSTASSVRFSIGMLKIIAFPHETTSCKFQLPLLYECTSYYSYSGNNQS